jgi:hypothetical protein
MWTRADQWSPQRSWLRAPDGAFIDPGVPAGYSSSFLRSLNDRGDGVGAVAGRAAVRHADGTWTLMLPGVPSTGFAINNSGVVVGTDDTDYERRRPFLYDPATGVSPLPLPAGARQYLSGDASLDINDYGIIAGDATRLPPQSRAFRKTSASAAVFLPTQNDTFSFAAGVNDAGVIVGVMGAARPVKWMPDNTLIELHNMSSGFVVPNAINNRGDIVGTGMLAGPRAVLWSEDYGSIDLNNLLTPEQARHWELRLAVDINDNRQIIGLGLFDPDGPGPEPQFTHGFVMTLAHLPEPSLGAVVMVGIVVLLNRQRRRRAAA